LIHLDSQLPPPLSKSDETSTGEKERYEGLKLAKIQGNRKGQDEKQCPRDTRN